MHICPKKEVSEPGVRFIERAEDNLAVFSLVASLDKGSYWKEKSREKSVSAFRLLGQVYCC